MTIDEIRELIQLVSDTGIAELEVQRGDNRVRIRKSFGSDTTTLVQSAGLAPAAPTSPAPAAAPKPEAAPAPAADAGLFHQKSPIVGTFYDCPAPDQPPFVNVGDRVSVGQTLCIIEAMKLMNAIEAEVAGVVESKLVENGHPVEYGEALFAIRPV
jgi:acetyl-CoA carboxylase biotin carboxyl carrier protein